jgi:hypothetical protein
MNGSSLLLFLVAIGLGLAALFLFSAPGMGPEPAATPVPARAQEMGGSSLESYAGAGRPSLVADAGVDVTVGERETIRLAGIGYDAAGGPVTTLWSAEPRLGFFSDPHTLDSTYTAPSACDCEDCVTLTLTVFGRSGASASDTVTLHVRDLLACPSSRTTCGSPPAVVKCCTTPAPVVDRCPKPDVPCDSPCMSQAPAVPACGQVPVACRCNQGCGPTWDAAWPTSSAPLAARDRPRPMIVRQFEPHVLEGTSVRLRGTIANPSCASVCYVWSATKGWFEGADTLEPVYHAPWTDRLDGEAVIVTLTAYDAAPGASYDQIRFRIDNGGH